MRSVFAPPQRNLETRIPLLSLEEEQILFGPHDRHVKQVSRRFNVRFSSRGGNLRLQGGDDEVKLLAARVEDLLQAIRGGKEFEPAQIADALLGTTFAEDAVGRGANARDIVLDAKTSRRKGDGLPTARTPAQQRYLDLLDNNELVFSAGPAGTGKTFLAVAAAVRALRDGAVKRLCSLAQRWKLANTWDSCPAT